jgi:uncharacterized protein (DUF433 family)
MFTRKLIASAVAAATLAGGGLAVAALNPLSSAGAQEHTATTTPDPSTSRTAHPRCAERRHRMNRRDVVKLVADTIHIPVEDLVAELKDGTSIAEVAQAHHVDPKTVTDAIVARGTQRIDQAVARGDLDATRAAKLKARLPQLAERIVNHKRPA